nr:glycosyltransferase [Xylophilus sp.]
LSDRLVVTTQPLADAYGPYCNDVKIVPNCLNDAVWGQFYKGPPAPRQRLRVGWAGAGQHWGDLKMMVEVVATLSEQVDWVFMGMCPDVLRPYVKEFHPFVSFADYPAKLATLDLDLAIAPLEVNAFNEAKSNLRLLEYGAMGWPVVCSDVYPFRTQNPPVLHVPNTPQAWLQALQPLLTDPALRHRQGQALHQWVSEHFYLSRNANVWHQALFTPNPAQR